MVQRDTIGVADKTRRANAQQRVNVAAVNAGKRGFHLR
jgi:hypothetical protein